MEPRLRHLSCSQIRVPEEDPALSRCQRDVLCLSCPNQGGVGHFQRPWSHYFLYITKGSQQPNGAPLCLEPRLFQAQPRHSWLEEEPNQHVLCWLEPWCCLSEGPVSFPHFSSPCSGKLLTLLDSATHLEPSFCQQQLSEKPPPQEAPLCFGAFPRLLPTSQRLYFCPNFNILAVTRRWGVHFMLAYLGASKTRSTETNIYYIFTKW